MIGNAFTILSKGKCQSKYLEYMNNLPPWEFWLLASIREYVAAFCCGAKGMFTLDEDEESIIFSINMQDKKLWLEMHL